MSKWVVVLAALVVLATTQDARAQTKAKGRAPRGIVTLRETKIALRPQRPIAATEIARAHTTRGGSKLRKTFVERIGRTIHREPF